jgi:hypothetical protein
MRCSLASCPFLPLYAAVCRRTHSHGLDALLKILKNVDSFLFLAPWLRVHMPTGTPSVPFHGPLLRITSLMERRYRLGLLALVGSLLLIQHARPASAQCSASVVASCAAGATCYTINDPCTDNTETIQCQPEAGMDCTYMGQNLGCNNNFASFGCSCQCSAPAPAPAQPTTPPSVGCGMQAVSSCAGQGSCFTDPCGSNTVFYTCTPPQEGMVCYATGSLSTTCNNGDALFSAPCPCSCSFPTTTVPLTGAAAAACANACPAGYNCQFTGGTATNPPITTKASNSAQFTIVGATFGLMGGALVIGLILKKIAAPKPSAPASDSDIPLSGIEYRAFSDSGDGDDAAPINKGIAAAGVTPSLSVVGDVWECPSFGSNKRVWLAATVCSLFNAAGMQRPLRVYLAVSHPFLTVFYNENTRRFGCCDTNPATAMPKQRRLRIGSLITSLCISIALSIAVATINQGGSTTNSNVQCVNPSNPGDTVSVVQSSSNGGSVATATSTTASLIVSAIGIFTGVALNSLTDGVVQMQKRGWVFHSLAQTLTALLLIPVGVGWIVLSALVAHRSGTQIALYVYVAIVSTAISWIGVDNAVNFGKWIAGKLLAGSYGQGASKA